MILSTRVKEAVKTALAMTIAYGIALSMDWDRPYWAGFAVAMISLSTVGQSLNKGAMRMLGTLVAFVVALTLIALFPQDRWLSMLFLSAWVGFCTYMNTGSKLQYFWFVAGFVSIIICLDGGVNSVNAFETALLRAEETGLGILVYSLVSILLWPSNTGADFDAATRKLASTQHQLYRSYLGLMSGQGNAGEAQGLRAQEVQEQTRFGQLLDAAVTDSYEVWELRRQWRRYRGQAADLIETMERWRESFAEVQALDLQPLLPNLAVFGAELDERLAQIGRMLAGDAPAQLPQAMELSFDQDAARNLSHFHKAALAVTRSRLQHLERLTRSLFDSVSDIGGFGRAGAPAGEDRARAVGFVPDPERLASVIRFMATFWLAYLAYLYISDIPGGIGFVSMAGGPIAIVLASQPQLSVSRLFVPVATSVLFAGVLYIFVMPQLSSFAGLGLMIFAATFAICYLFAAPRQALGRAFGLAMFVTIAAISNQQTYSFLSVANTALMFPLAFLLWAITAYIPFSPRPERAFLRLLGRFFRSGEYLLSTMRWDPTGSPTRLDRWRRALHSRELASLPKKLGAWAPHIDTKALPGTSPEQVQALVTSLQALTYRMQELLEARANPQAQFLVQELLEDIRAWRLVVQDAFQRMSKDPAIGETERSHAILDEILERLETRVEETLDKAAEGQLSARDGENFYRLLGAFRGISEALVGYIVNAGAIEWGRWREARF